MDHEGISAALDLEGLRAIGISVTPEAVELVIESQFEAGCCPKCGRASAEPKDRPQVLVRDLSICGRATLLRWVKRRWRCTNCCVTWTESHPQIPHRAQMTARYKAYLADRASAEGNFSQVAKAEAVSYYTVAQAHRRRADLVRRLRPTPAPKMICIDEAAIKKGHNYNTVITDAVGRYVIDVIPGRETKGLVKCLAGLDEQTREGIEAVAIDMWPAYRRAVALWLPNARIVADKFHVIRQANRALDSVRRRLSVGGYKSPTGFPRRLYDARYALLRASESLRPSDNDRLDFVFARFPELQLAWHLKEGLREIYGTCQNERQAGIDLNSWLGQIDNAGIAEFDRLAKTFRKWSPLILAYFDQRVTNALAEGITNKIKVIKRQAYGMRNFDNFADRIMVQCGLPKPRAHPRLIA